jgi:hypothetical protein
MIALLVFIVGKRRLNLIEKLDQETEKILTVPINVQ